MPPPPPDAPLSPALLVALGLIAGCIGDSDKDTATACLQPTTSPCLLYATTPTADTEDTAATTTTTQSKAETFERLKTEGVLPPDVAERLTSED